MRTALIAPWVLASVMLGGCATSDYVRITDKISAYEEQAASTRAEMAASSDPAVKLRGYRTLIRLTEKELEIARRIDPSTNPAYRAKSITAEQARKDKEDRVKTLQAQMGELIKGRDAEEAKLRSSPKPATAPASAQPPSPAPAPAPAH